MNEYNTYLFDADGTLIDTTDLIVECYRSTLSHFGFPPQKRETVVGLIGIPLVQQMQSFIGDLPPLKLKEITEFYMKYQLEIHEKFLKEGPGTKATLHELKKRKAKLAVVTSRTRKTLDIYLKSIEIFDYFDLIITPEDVTNPKPHHEPCTKSLKILGSKPENTVFVGDAVYDQQSAIAGGIDFAYVKWSHIPIEKFSPFPDHILKSMTDLII